MLESAATEGKIRCEGERPLEIGSGEAKSIKQLVKTIFSLIPTSLSRVVLLPAMNPSASYNRANLGKAKSVLNWEPKVTLVEGLKKYIEDIQQRTIAALQHRAFVLCPSPFREKEEREGWSVSRLAYWRESIKARLSSLQVSSIIYDVCSPNACYHSALGAKSLSTCLEIFQIIYLTKRRLQFAVTTQT